MTMTFEMNDNYYLGFRLDYVQGSEWKLVLGQHEYIFPDAQSAEKAIRLFHEDLVQKYNARKIK